MAKNSTMKKMQTKMQEDFDKFVNNFQSNLRVRTPIRTGAARRAWSKVGNLRLEVVLLRRFLLTPLAMPVS